MTRLALLLLLAVLCLAIAPAPSRAQISAKLVMEDQRSSEHILWLKWKWSGSKLEAHLVLSDKEILEAESWELCFESEQGLVNVVTICRAVLDSTKAVEGTRRVQIKGREIRTLRGRAWLVESIRTM